MPASTTKKGSKAKGFGSNTTYAKAQREFEKLMEEKEQRKKRQAAKGDSTVCSASVTSKDSSAKSAKSSKSGFSLFRSIKKHTSCPTEVPNNISVSTPAKAAPPVPKKIHDLSVEQKIAEESLSKLKVAIETQENRETELNKQITEEMAAAKTKLSAGNKRAAVRTMKMVKLQQAELDKISEVISTMETQVHSIQSALNNIQIMEAMQAGSQTMEQLNKAGEKDADQNMMKLETLIDQVRESMDCANEVNAILSKPVDNVIVEDDDTLLQELMGMMDSAPVSTDSMEVELISMPSAPTSSLVQVKEPAASTAASPIAR